MRPYIETFGNSGRSWRTVAAICTVGLALACCWTGASRSAADEPAAPNAGAPAASTNTVSSADQKDQLVRRRAELADRIARLKRGVAQDSAAKSSAESAESVSRRTAEIELLKSLDIQLMQHQAALEDQVEQQAEFQRWTAEFEQLRERGISEPRPYSLMLLDDARDQLAAEESRRNSVEGEIAAARQLLETARTRLDELQRERRRLQDHGGDDANSETAGQLRLAELDCVVAAEAVALRRAELDGKQRQATACEVRHKYYSERIALLEPHVAFTTADVDRVRQRLDSFEAEFRAQLQRVEENLAGIAAAEQQWRRGATDSAVDSEVAEEAENTWRMIQQIAQEECRLINQQLLDASRMRDFVGWRYRFWNKQATTGEVEVWYEQLRQFVETSALTEAALSRRVEEQRVVMSTISRRMRASGAQQAEIRPWLEQRMKHAQGLVDICNMAIINRKAGQRAVQRFVDEIEKSLPNKASTSWWERLKEASAGVWEYELTSVDDRPITVGKVLGALTYLIIGVICARLVSRLAGRRVLPKVGMDRGAAVAVQSITFYTLCVVFAFLALEAAHLPITAFTFLGGAAAIGVGFGSQNILNNFISGLILLAEQPIRVGDVVSLDGTFGTVEHIGARSTRVRTGTNFELIVPNSKLLENNVVNLTLTDNCVRSKVVVGVAYGSSVAEVKQMLQTAVQSHRLVLRDPAPAILFADFADNALTFEVHFSLRIQAYGECRQVESDLRETIDELFRAAGISVPFPQRDVTLQFAQPLEVRWPSQNSAAPASSPPMMGLDPSVTGAVRRKAA